MPILRLAELRNSRKEQYPVGVTIEEFPSTPNSRVCVPSWCSSGGGGRHNAADGARFVLVEGLHRLEAAKAWRKDHLRLPGGCAEALNGRALVSRACRN